MSNHKSKIQGRKFLNWLGLLVITSFLVLVCRLPATAAGARHYTELEFAPLPEIQLPDYTRYQLNNGIVVYLVEDHELPLVGGTALIRTGDRLEPPDKIGLATLVGTVMRTGGTLKHSSDELNQLLEQRAAAVETGVDLTSGSAGFSALSEDLETVFDLFAQVIQEPTFTQEKLDLAKKQIAGRIARRNDDPNDIAGRQFQKLIYGEDSPYARTVEYKTLDNISREDVLAFYQQYFHPENLILGIVGDFNTAKMQKLIEKKFGQWQSASISAKPMVPEASQAKKGGVFFVNQPQLSQSYIQMGHLGGKRDNPDYPALSVLNELFNGFGGRLFNQVRSRQGLAYSVYGYWSAAYDYPGIFIAGGQTRSEATVPLIKALLSEIEQIRNTSVKPEVLKRAKEGVMNSFVFNFQDPSQTLSRLMRYEYYGYPEDFIFQYRKGVEATTVADIQRVAKKYLHPDEIITLVVGNAETILPPLSSLSEKVTSVDITIPEPTNS
ncbi:MAG: pitrilysin family protein [Coleofasciculaceae cyanobacterium]